MLFGDPDLYKPSCSSRFGRTIELRVDPAPIRKEPREASHGVLLVPNTDTFATCSTKKC